MTKGFYRFKIENRRGQYRLKIGTEGDRISEYGYVATTYFAKLCPPSGKTFDNEQEAQKALRTLKLFLFSHPLYKTGGMYGYYRWFKFRDAGLKNLLTFRKTLLK